MPQNQKAVLAVNKKVKKKIELKHKQKKKIVILNQNSKPKVAKKKTTKKVKKKVAAPAIKLETIDKNKEINFIVSSDGPIRVYTLRDIYEGRRIQMAHIGIDIGTKNIVMAIRDDKETVFLREINGYFIYPRATKFMRNMLDDPNKERSDGTKRPARWVEFEGNEGIYVLGGDAQELAYSHNDTMQRPMAEGGVSSNEDAMMVLASIVQGLLDMAENEIGEFEGKVHICYCTTAPAVNKETVSVDYHRQVVDMIINGYESNAELIADSIKESHAIVLKDSESGTGIGISWGAGTVTVSYVKWGDEIFSFCWVGSGDWIDLEVAKRHGYDPKSHSKSKETPTTVCAVKEQIDLTPGEEPTDRIPLDIVFHYKTLIDTVIKGIIQGFNDNEDQARIDDGIDIYMAGGTCSPPGFVERVKEALEENQMPFEISDVIRCENPLYAVAEGCLKAAEMS
jgi:hypothetical protein